MKERAEKVIEKFNDLIKKCGKHKSLKKTLKRELAFFITACDISDFDLDEEGLTRYENKLNEIENDLKGE